MWWTQEAGSSDSPRKLGNWESGIWGSHWLVDPAKGGLGNSETRNLEFVCPPDRTQEGASETRKLRITGIWGPLGSEPDRGPLKLGNSESGICRGVSRNLHTRNLGIWNLRRSILESAHEETKNLEIGVPPWTHRGALESWKLATQKLGICFYLEFAEEYPGICTLGNMESGFWGPSADPQRGPETRKIGIWILQRSIPWRICTLGNMLHGI